MEESKTISFLKEKNMLDYYFSYFDSLLEGKKIIREWTLKIKENPSLWLFLNYSNFDFNEYFLQKTLFNARQIFLGME